MRNFPLKKKLFRNHNLYIWFLKSFSYIKNFSIFAIFKLNFLFLKQEKKELIFFCNSARIAKHSLYESKKTTSALSSLKINSLSREYSFDFMRIKKNKKNQWKSILIQIYDIILFLNNLNLFVVIILRRSDSS